MRLQGPQCAGLVVFVGQLLQDKLRLAYKFYGKQC